MKDQKQLLLKCQRNDIPVFVVCGSDVNSIETMEQYYIIAEKNGCSNEFLQDMKLAIEDFKAFRIQEPDKIKLPDMSPQIDESLYYTSKDRGLSERNQQSDTQISL